MSKFAFRSISSRILITLILVLTFAAVGLAQTGFGSIGGTILDQTGAVVNGAKVVVENPSKGIRRELVSNGAGVFSAPALVPATGYTVTVTAPNFGKYEVKSLDLQVGETKVINAVLKPAAAGAVVEVTAAAPIVDFAKTDTSSVVGSQQILELPINGRRVDQFVLLTPGVTNDGAFGLLSFRGNPGGNTFLTDGIDTTNSYYGENAGRTRTYNISQDAVQEFQVVSANFAAEYGKASGGVVNTVTRSGTNAYHGSAYEFFRNASLAAKDATTVLPIKTNGLDFTHGINPPEWRHQAGLSVGGPIVKEKLFFFFNGELFRRNAPAVSTNLNAGAGNNLFDGSGNYKTGQACAPGTYVVPNGTSATLTSVTLTANQCAAANDWVQGRVLPQLIARSMDNNLLFGKLDYHPTSKDTISANFNYLDFRSPNGIQTQLSLTNGSAIGNNADTNVFDRTGRLSWTRVLGATALNEFRFGIFKDRQIDPASQSLIPSFGSAGNAISALTINSVSNLGDAVNYSRVNPSELRTEFSDTFSKVVGKSNLKFGVDVTRLQDHVLSMNSQYPTYSYSTMTVSTDPNATAANVKSTQETINPMTLFAMDFNDLGARAYTSFSQTVGNRQVDMAIWETSFFAQDEWKVTPKLTITPGLRYEYTTVPTPKAGSATVSGCNPAMDTEIQAVTGVAKMGTCYIPTFQRAWAPRLGLAYAVNSKTAIHAGYGIFQDRYTTSTLENLLVSTGMYQKAYSYSTSSYFGSVTSSADNKKYSTFGTWPTVQNCLGTNFPGMEAWGWSPSASCSQTLSPDLFFADTKYRNPYSQQATIAIDREIAKNTNLSVSYVWSRSLHINVQKDTNVVKDATKTVQYMIYDDANATQYSKSSPLYPVFSGYNPGYVVPGTTTQYKGRVTELQAAGNSYYNALLVNVNRRYSNWFQGSASYTFGHTIDNGIGATPTFGSVTPTSFYNSNYRAQKGSSQLDRRHNLVMNAVFTPTFMKNEGWFAKQVVNGWTVAMVEQLATAEPTYPGYYSAASGNINGGVRSGLNGLGVTSIIPFDSLSDLNVGSIIRTDMRLSKTFRITERVNVQAGIEAVNLLNTLLVSGRNYTKYTLCNVTGTSTSATNGCVPSTMGYTTSGTNTVYKVIPYTLGAAYGSISATQITPDGTTARRAQAMVRINF